MIPLVLTWLIINKFENRCSNIDMSWFYLFKLELLMSLKSIYILYASSFNSAVWWDAWKLMEIDVITTLSRVICGWQSNIWDLFWREDLQLHCIDSETLLCIKKLRNISHPSLDECSLTCRKGSYAYPQHRPVKDGTRCTNDPTTKDVCIQGKCKVRWFTLFCLVCFLFLPSYISFVLQFGPNF